MQSYTWNNYRCTYELYQSNGNNADKTPLVLVHPIGVGLSHHFWDRFCQEWLNKGYKNPIYNPDLLGCGESDMPHVAYYPSDWAEQLQYFIKTVVQKPVILVVQGALLPVGIALTRLQPNYIKGLVLSGPPTVSLITENKSSFSQKLRWNLLFDSAFGNAFYRYARSEKFLRSFSINQLFANEQDVDREWLDTLKIGAKNPDSRYAVFSFLAGFWRKNWQEEIGTINQPTLIVMGEAASSIAKSNQRDKSDERLNDYLKYFPNPKGVKIPGRNVLPYESTSEFVQAIAPFIQQL